MRVNVIGESAAAKTLRNYLESQGHAISNTRPAYTLRIEPGSSTSIVVEGAPGRLAEEARRTIEELRTEPVEWRPTDQGSSRELRVVARDDVDDAVERGLLRAILRMERDRRRSGWLWGRP